MAKSDASSGATREALEESLVQLKAELAEMQEHIEDFSHKENVKVYRNVQAAVGEELNKKVTELTELMNTQSGEATTQRAEQTRELQRKQEELSRQMAGVQEVLNQVVQKISEKSSKGSRATMILQIVSLLAVLANLVLLLYATGII